MTETEVFCPVDGFDWCVNRSERCQQVRLLVPLPDSLGGRSWLLRKLNCRFVSDEASSSHVFHFCFPLRDVFTADYNQCRGNRALEDQFIAVYNRLFGLPERFGVEEIWRTAPGEQIRHPAAGGRAGWYNDFLRERVRDDELRSRARDMRRMLATEADVLVLTDNHVVVIECKYRGRLSVEQYTRQKMMGATLARRLGKSLHLGMVVNQERDSTHARIRVPHVLWREIERWLEGAEA